MPHRLCFQIPQFLVVETSKEKRTSSLTDVSSIREHGRSSVQTGSMEQSRLPRQEGDVGADTGVAGSRLQREPRGFQTEGTTTGKAEAGVLLRSCKGFGGLVKRSEAGRRN